MISILLFLVIIFSGCFFASTYGKHIKDMFPISCMGIILLLFVIGIVSNLNIAFSCVCLLSVLFLGGGLYNCTRKSRWDNVKLNFFNKILIPIGAVLAFFLWCDVGMRGGCTSDDFTHWIYIVKEMTRLNDFGTNPSANAMFASYPPGMALFQYFLERLCVITDSVRDFSEWRCYYAYHILLMSTCFPFLKKGGNIYQSLLLLGTFFLLPTAFYMAYYDLSIEIAIAVLTGSALTRILLETEKDIVYSAYIFLSCAVIVLLKDAGLLFAAFIGIAYVTDRMYTGNTGLKQTLQNPLQRKNMIKTTFLAFSSVAAPKLIWNIQLKITDTQLKFPQTVSLKTVLLALTGNDEYYQTHVWNNFIKALFHRSVLIDSPWSSSSLVQPAWKASYVCLGLMFIIILFTLNKFQCDHLKNRAGRGTEYKRRTTLTVIYSLLAFTYVIGIGMAYLSNFSRHEAEILAAFSRYVQVPFLMLYITIMLYLTEIGFSLKQWTSVICCAVCIIALYISPKSYVIDYADRTYVEQSYMRRQKYEYLGNLIKENCTENDKVCFIDQNGWLYPYVTIKFDIRPIYMGIVGDWSSWFLTEGYLDNNPERLFDILRENYDYLAIYQTDEYFINTYSQLFDGKVTGESLWIVDKDNHILQKMN